MSVEKSVRDELIALYKNGLTIIDLTKMFNISKSTVYNWLNEDKKLKSSNSSINISKRDYYNLKRKFDRVKIENDIYKEIRCTAFDDLETKLSEIDRLSNKYSIHSLCRLMNVLRSTYYHYINRVKETQIDKEDKVFKIIIEKLFYEYHEVIGPKKIKYLMEQDGHIISPKRVSRLMNEIGLKVKKAKKKKVYDAPLEYKPYYTDKVCRKFNPELPNEIWVSDITQVKIKDTRYYICVVIDLFSRKVISYELSSNMNSSIVSATFLEAYIKRGLPQNLIFHSDQGAQYKSNIFRKRLSDCNVTQSLSQPGSPYDNAVVEAFFSLLKKEAINRYEYKRVTELSQIVIDYIEFYNKKRPHSSLNYLSPVLYEEQYYNK